MSIKVNPSKFLDTEIMIKNGIIKTSVVVKESKIPNHWSSVVPKKKKKNIEKQFTLEYAFVNQMNTMHWNLSKNCKVLQKKSTPLL